MILGFYSTLTEESEVNEIPKHSTLLA